MSHSQRVIETMKQSELKITVENDSSMSRFLDNAYYTGACFDFVLGNIKYDYAKVYNVIDLTLRSSKTFVIICYIE